MTELRGRELHRFVRHRIEAARGDRPWSWLAEESGVSASTLSTQVTRPKFSVDVLIAIAGALGREASDFLPRSHGPARRPVDDVLDDLSRFLGHSRSRFPRSDT